MGIFDFLKTKSKDENNSSIDRQQNRKVAKVKLSDSTFSYHDNILIVSVNIGSSNFGMENSSQIVSSIDSNLNDLSNVKFEFMKSTDNVKGTILIAERARSLKFEAFIMSAQNPASGMKIVFGFLIPVLPNKKPRIVQCETLNSFKDNFEIVNYSKSTDKTLKVTSQLFNSVIK